MCITFHLLRLFFENTIEQTHTILTPLQVQLLREKFPLLDIEVDGGLSLSTIDVAAKVCYK